tara:strand:+ start:211 stop:1872 length:1662 start_codon:yes stop_codon:yes gene_type:complete
MKIKEFNFSLNDISNLGEVRNFSIVGDDGAIFSLVLKRTIGSVVTYYNFSTNTFGSEYKRLKNRRCNNGIFNDSIVFPAGELGSNADPNIYNLYLYAEHALGTTHIPYVEARFTDDTIDINSCVGSNSAVLEKILYQYPSVGVSISASSVSPSIPTYLQGTSHSNASFTFQRETSTGVLPFSAQVTLGSTKVGRILKQPQASDIASFVSFTPQYPLPIPGVTANFNNESGISLTITNLPRSSSNTLVVAEPGSVAVGMTIKGVAIDGVHDIDYPVIITAVLDNTITVNKNLTIANVVANATITANDIRYRRWLIHSNSSVHTLVPGLVCIGSHLQDNTTIQRYLDQTTYNTEVTAEDGSVTDDTFTVTNFDIPAIDTLGQKPTISNGIVTNQQGYITFNKAQVVSTMTATKAYAYGQNALITTTGLDVSFTDLKIEVADVNTTVNDADANGTDPLTTFDVASVSGIMDDVSVMSGVNLNSGVTTPVVTNISGSTITVTPGAHKLQNGQGLTFKGAGRVFTLSGNVEFNSITPVGGSPSLISLSFDLEKLIAAS